MLYKPQSRGPVVEIGQGGAGREVPLGLPAGYDLDGILPGSDRWIARLRRKNAAASQTGTIDTSAKGGDYLLAELNPSDGTTRRLFSMESGSYFDVVCAADDALIAYSIDEGSQFLISYTDLPK